MVDALDSETIGEMKIRQSRRGAFVNALVDAIVTVSALAAVYNLVCREVVAASAIWLLLVCMIARSAFRDAGGIRWFIVRRVGGVVSEHIVEIAESGAGSQSLRFGYDLFNRRLYYLVLRCEGIRSVDWSPGQASGLAGHDMNDWQVALWVDSDLVTMNPTPYRHGVHLVGPARRRQDTERLGNRFIDFLRNAGVAVAQPPSTILRGLIGERACVSSPLHPVGKVTLGPEEYPARPIRGFIDGATRVRVVDVIGLSLVVEPIESRPDASVRMSAETSGRDL